MSERKQIVGWREWVNLPELGIERIKAKIDTGARTSALHAFKLDTYEEKGVLRVRFHIHPLPKKKSVVSICDAEVVDKRLVTDSGGHCEMRYVINTALHIGMFSWPIEVTLTNRDTMKFRMLLGRTAMQEHLVVDPDQSYLIGKKPPKIKKDKV
jgi:hypothetical protein